MRKTNTSNIRFYENNKLVYFILISFSFLLYGNSISHSYSVDDELVTNTDRQIHPLVDQGLSAIPEIFTSHYAQNTEQTYEYRPVVITTFAIEKSLFGSYVRRVHISHFIQVLLYGLLGLVIFSLLNQVFKKEKTALCFLIALVFLSLPVHAEVVNSLKNRDELLSLIFSLLAFSQAFKFADHKRLLSLVWSGLFFLLALMSKKTALPFLAIIPIGLYFFRSLQLKNLGFVFLSLALARILFAAFKIGLVDETKLRTFSTLENPLFGQDFMSRIPSFFYSIYWYFKSALSHWDFHFYYGFGALPQVNYSHPMFIMSFVLVMGLLSVLSYGIVKKKYAGMNFGIIFFLLSIFGACNLLFPMVGIVAERLVFTASLGIVIALAFLINGARDKSWGKGIILPSVVMLYLGVNTFLVIQHNPDWKNRITLFQKDTENNFPSAKSQAVYGQELQFLINQEWLNPSGRDIDMFNSILKAQEAYQLSLKTYPNYPKIENNLAYLYSMYFQDHAKAIEITKKLLKQNPSYREARENQLSATLKVFTTWCKLPHDLNDLRWKADQEPITTNQAEFSLIQQFEERGKAVLSKGMNPEAIEDLVSFAQGIEIINPTLANLKPPFSETVNKQLNLLYSGARPSYNILDTFRIALAENFSHPLSNREFQETKNKLRDICIREARTFDQMHQGTWALDLVDKYFIEAQDYEGIIAIHKEQIKNGRGSSKDYIQIGNAYLNLGDKTKALMALEKGYDFIEQSKLRNKASELLRLQHFIEKITSSN